MKYKTIAANLSAIGYRAQKPNKTYIMTLTTKVQTILTANKRLTIFN